MVRTRRHFRLLREAGKGQRGDSVPLNPSPVAESRQYVPNVSAVLACRRIQAVDQEMFRHVGVEPSKLPIPIVLPSADIDGQNRLPSACLVTCTGVPPFAGIL